MSGIDSDLIRGHIDTIILKSLYHGDKYGLEIIQEIEEKSNGTYELKQPTLYSCLKRLESQGLISSYWEDSDIGGRRHYYTLTDKGKEAYQANQEDWLRSREIIDNLIYNTSIDYAPIYPDGENLENKPVQQNNNEENTIEETDSNQDLSNQNIEESDSDEINKNINSDQTNDYLADEQSADDEFETFDDTEETPSDSFFASNNEIADDEPAEFNEEESPSILVDNSNPEKFDDNLISLNLDDNIEEEIAPEDNQIEDSINDEQNDNLETNHDDDDQIYEGFNQSENDDDEIYSPENDIPEDEQIYVPEDDVEEEQPEEEDNSPTYINFSNNNYEEADITNIDENQENDNKENSYYDANIDNKDNNQVEEYNAADNEQTNSIEETANTINEQYYKEEIPHASEEEINNLYKTTENYNNIQAGYTDEKYKQALTELESYAGGTTVNETHKKDKSSVYSFAQLKEMLEQDGITIKKHERLLKENDDSKMYIKTNQIHLVKNWAVWGTTTFTLMLIFIVMNAFKQNFTYNFAFWPFALAIGLTLIIPIYSSIKYAINPYKKVIAKYAPRLSILINLLITIQLIIITYCVNLQVGFYSFSQENYNHLIWVIPLVISFIPILQAFTYMFLYNSKRFHA